MANKTVSKDKAAIKPPPRNRALTEAPSQKRVARTAAMLSRRNIKTSEVVALDIVRDIVSRRFKTGDKLPLEAELLQEYRVSRSSLREALRLLEVQGLITIRPGPGGGTVVGAVHPVALGRTLMLHMHMIEATYDELLDTWILIESVLAEQAAKNPDRVAVRRAMTPFVEVGTNGSARKIHAIDEGLEFHTAVGELASNRVLDFLLRTPGSIVTEHIISLIDREKLEEQIVHDHSAVAKAIIAGDAAKARRKMQDHLNNVVNHFRAFWPQRVGEKIQWR